jgi:hypothetical protein
MGGSSKSYDEDSKKHKKEKTHETHKETNKSK